jgi:hypothetical protein
MNINYPVLTIQDTRIQVSQSRRKDLDYIEYELTYDDVITFRGHVLETVAIRFYGDRKLWSLIYDYNPVIMPDEFTEGMLIRVPIFNSSTVRRSMSYLGQSK